MATVRLEGFDMGKPTSPASSSVAGSGLFPGGASFGQEGGDLPTSFSVYEAQKGLTDLDLEFEQTLNSYIHQFNASNPDQNPIGLVASTSQPQQQLASGSPATMTPAMMLPKYMSTLSMHTPPVTSATGSPAATDYAFPSPGEPQHAGERFKSPGKARSLSRESRERTGRTSQVGKAPTARQRSRSARRSASSAYAAPSSHAAAANPASALAEETTTPSTSTAVPTSVPMNYIEGSPWTGGAGYSTGMAISNSQHDAPIDELGWAPSEAGSASASTSVASSVPVPSSIRKSRILHNVAEESTSPVQGSQMQPQSQSGRLATVTDKKKKRRESHNAVERRRRDNINERIAELATLLPAMLLEESPSQKRIDEDGNPGSPGDEPGTPCLPVPALGNSPSLTVAPLPSRDAPKANKGTVLAKSVEYIKYLQQLVQLHAERNADLERTIQNIRAGGSGASTARPAPPKHLSFSRDASSSRTSASGGRDSSFSPDAYQAGDSYEDEGERGRSSNPAAVPRTGRTVSANTHSRDASNSFGPAPFATSAPPQTIDSSVNSSTSNSLMLDGADFAEFEQFDWMANQKPFSLESPGMRL